MDIWKKLYEDANSEEITSYTVNIAEFNPTLLNVEQDITVTYTHAGRSASATFPVIVYGVPVVSVTTEPSDYSGGWTKNDVTFILNSTSRWALWSRNRYTVTAAFSVTAIIYKWIYAVIHCLHLLSI